MVHKLEMTPNGAWSAWPVCISTLAWILSLSSVAACSFLTRSVSIKAEVSDLVAEKSILLLHDHGVGFWGWEAEGSCYSYSINGNDPSFDGAFKASNAFTTLTTLLGGIGMMYCWLGTCFMIKPSRYEQIGYLFLLTSVFDVSTLVTMASNICQPGFFDYATPGTNLSSLMSTSCGMGAGSILSLVSAIFWAVSAGICLRSPLASKSRTTRREVDPSLKQQYRDDVLDDEDEDDEDDERTRHQEETQRRYQDMFGEEGEGEEEDYYQTDGGQGFQSSLAQVQEADYEDEDYQSDRRSARNPFGDDQSGGSRSQYSQEVRSRHSVGEEEGSYYSGEERSQSNRSGDQVAYGGGGEEQSHGEVSYYSRSQYDGQSNGSQSQGSEMV